MDIKKNIETKVSETINHIKRKKYVNEKTNCVNEENNISDTKNDMNIENHESGVSNYVEERNHVNIEINCTDKGQSDKSNFMNEESLAENQQEYEDGPNSIQRDLYVVPDGGWGWMVATGSFIITMLLSSISPCFGILFSRYLIDHSSSSVMTAWIFNTQLLIWHLMGPIVRPLSAQFGWRPVGFFGVLSCSLSIITSALSSSVPILFLSFSLLSGVGGGLAVSMCYIIVPQYFNRRRGQANALMMVGLCMGQILGAPLVRYLQDQYGFLGSTLIFGAITLNACIGVAFFHPLEWHLKKTNKVENVTQKSPKEIKPLISQTRNCIKGTMVNKDRTDNFQYDEYITDSSTIKHQRISKTLDTCKKLKYILEQVMKSTIKDMKILRYRRALIIVFSNMLCMNAYFNFVMMVPFAMQASNFSLQQAAWCITIMGIFNLITRVIISLLTDWAKFDIRVCSLVGYAILSIVMFVFPLINDESTMVVLMAIFGCGLAATISLLHLVMIKYLGVENLAPIFGSTCLFIGFGFPVFGTLIGFIRDLSNSYTLSMWILSAMTLAAFILMVFMPKATAFDLKQKKSDKKNVY